MTRQQRVDSRRDCGDRAPIKFWTIGYEGATQPDLIAVLSAAGIETLVDVRAVPLSRKPGFSKNVLAAGLHDAGIDYLNLKALGTPPEGREAARKGHHDQLKTVYAGQLELPEAMAQTAHLLDLASEKRVALLCFERDPARCHRSLLLDHAAPDAEIIDLFP